MTETLFGGHIFVNVNEEDVPYDKHDNLADALAVLERFPNDTVVVCYADSPVGRSMTQEVLGDPTNAT